MKKPYFLFLTLFFISCKYVENQVPTEKELLEKELQTINWNKVDEYPSVLDCDKILDKQQQQKCFFEVVSKLIYEKLELDTLSILYPELDDFEIKITILPDANVVFEPQFKNDSITSETKILSSIIKARLIDFPKMDPAIKRGVPVKTQFILPFGVDKK